MSNSVPVLSVSTSGLNSLIPHLKFLESNITYAGKDEERAKTEEDPITPNDIQYAIDCLNNQDLDRTRLHPAMKVAIEEASATDLQEMLQGMPETNDQTSTNLHKVFEVNDLDFENFLATEEGTNSIEDQDRTGTVSDIFYNLASVAKFLLPIKESLTEFFERSKENIANLIAPINPDIIEDKRDTLEPITKLFGIENPIPEPNS